MQRSDGPRLSIILRDSMNRQFRYISAAVLSIGASGFLFGIIPAQACA